MTLLEQLNSDITVAMKNKDKEALSILRLVKSSLQNEEIAKGSPLSSDDELTVVSREMKQRKESLAEFKKANRDDLVLKTEQGIAIVSRYLPQPLTDEELTTLIQRAIDKTSASSMKDFGKVMGVIMPQVKGRADGQKVNTLVKKLIS